MKSTLPDKAASYSEAQMLQRIKDYEDDDRACHVILWLAGAVGVALLAAIAVLVKVFCY